jgi:E3 ubiquitin-protein ligase ZNRF1/2
LDSPLAANISLGRVYTAHSLPSHIWSLNGEYANVTCLSFMINDE